MFLLPSRCIPCLLPRHLSYEKVILFETRSAFEAYFRREIPTK